MKLTVDHFMIIAIILCAVFLVSVIIDCLFFLAGTN